eukprot:CAMPEP_0178664192 /NCGR_PEP_ID=MMETSP0698-20121128/29266_1 /TAXON_ID=265572 /ORGANISM="Extubocellulus spinifer, Strain CCMP396" /LENGTH=37 /DNA_ID= /DNA_START= /DNA_END= /DNA_ORIENTATION=
MECSEPGYFQHPAAAAAAQGIDGGDDENKKKVYDCIY